MQVFRAKMEGCETRLGVGEWRGLGPLCTCLWPKAELAVSTETEINPKAHWHESGFRIKDTTPNHKMRIRPAKLYRWAQDKLMKVR